ncbi:hypothetical protein DPMN_147035 [Dreissena polymorpha]|uniref:Uncharacterized protein n=1 Tax=Dreissena polymorpha TaxID=45954 RepID=A0A9D4IYY8_DREPO|nr:hypothetical protein DPMN_147035 [Dreissena polymorpha]
MVIDKAYGKTVSTLSVIAHSCQQKNTLSQEEHRHCSGSTTNTVHNITAGIVD